MSQTSHFQEKLSAAGDVGNGSAESDGESDLRSWDGDVTAHLFERSRIRALAGESLVVACAYCPLTREQRTSAAHCQLPIDPRSPATRVLRTGYARPPPRVSFAMHDCTNGRLCAAALLPLVSVWEAAQFCPSVSLSSSVLCRSNHLYLFMSFVPFGFTRRTLLLYLGARRGPI